MVPLKAEMGQNPQVFPFFSFLKNAESAMLSLPRVLWGAGSLCETASLGQNGQTNVLDSSFLVCCSTKQANSALPSDEAESGDLGAIPQPRSSSGVTAR